MKELGGGAAIIDAAEMEITEGSRSYRVPISREIGARDISQTVSVYTHGVAPARRNPDGEEVLYVVDGHGSCCIEGHLYALNPGTGVYLAPASVYQIQASNGDMTIVGVCCPEDTQAQVGVQPLRCEGDDTKPFRTVVEDTQKPIATGDRTFKLLVSQELGAQRITQFIGVIPPSRAPMHHHAYEEAIYIIEGNGVVRTENGSAEFAPGSSIYLPRGVSHCLENNGTRDVRLLGVFHPSGSPAARYHD